MRQRRADSEVGPYSGKARKKQNQEKDGGIKPPLQRRGLPGATGEFEGFGDGEKKFFGEWVADELDADGETAGGSGDGNGEAGESGKIEPLRVAHGFAVAANFFGRTLAGPRTPSSFSVSKGGRGGNRRQENVEALHRLENACALEIASGAFVDEFEHSEWRFHASRFEIIQKNWAELRFFSSDLLREELRDGRAEEKPPELESAVEIVELEWFDVEAGLFEKFSRAGDSGERFGSCWADRRRVEDTDADFFQFFRRSLFGGQRNAEGIVRIGAGEDVEKNAQVSGCARHGADDADPAEGTVARRNVSGGGNAARSWLESADAAEMGRDANRTAAIAADSAERTTGCDSCCFAAARTAGGVREIPRITGGSTDAIVGFVSHEEFWCVGAAEENGSGGAKALDDGRCARRNFVGAEKRACGNRPASDFDAALDGERDAVQLA